MNLDYVKWQIIFANIIQYPLNNIADNNNSKKNKVVPVKTFCCRESMDRLHISGTLTPMFLCTSF